MKVGDTAYYETQVKVLEIFPESSHCKVRFPTGEEWWVRVDRLYKTKEKIVSNTDKYEVGDEVKWVRVPEAHQHGIGEVIAGPFRLGDPTLPTSYIVRFRSGVTFLLSQRDLHPAQTWTKWATEVREYVTQIKPYAPRTVLEGTVKWVQNKLKDAPWDTES